MTPATAAAKPAQKVIPSIIFIQVGTIERVTCNRDCGHTIVPAHDLERSLQFYRQNLNFDQTGC